MMELITSEPMIWLKASTWFPFLARRLRGLEHIHREINHVNPPNSGLIICVTSFMMQSVLYTPPRVESFVREALAALQYKRHCDVFGIFFLDGYNIKLQGVVPGILQKDDGAVIRHLGPRRTRPMPVTMRINALETNEINAGEDYPLGPNPTLEEITDRLKSDPTSLILPWSWPVELNRYLNADEDSLLRSAAALFIDFTHIAWFTLAGTDPHVETLQQALEAWSLDEVLAKIDSASIRPTLKTRDKKSKREMDMQGFAAKRTFFFPGSDQKARGGRWRALFEFGGYVHHYRRIVRDIGQDEAHELDSYIEELLERCQCLPEVAPSGKSSMWMKISRQVLISANPLHLRIVSVGPRTGRRRGGQARGQAAQRSAQEIQREVLRRTGVTAEAAQEAMRIKKRQGEAMRDHSRRSGKSKNKRKPPPRGGKTAHSTDSGKLLPLLDVWRANSFSQNLEFPFE